ncbi:MAG: AmmeMemoRadiSam system protein B [Deltaproteobacteria bacterium]|nr:AmmeMemoRadiSam system protein B [Deltaproteobacteria bacterium]
MIRMACVAGQFYPGDGRALEKAVQACLSSAGAKKERAKAVIVPHAGYMYSGHVAGAVYSSVEIPDNIVLIGPNHTGLGQRASIMDSGVWETPLGSVNINEGLAGLILENCKLFSKDSLAHMREHSLEVQLPFLYHLNKNISIVPITVMHAEFRECSIMGKALAKALTEFKKDALIVVSSDMNHYESDSVTRKKDKLAVDKALALDAKGLLDITSSKDITMCGVIPAAMAIAAAKELNAENARLVKYATSGDVSGDHDQVVGYAGIIIN